MEHKKRRIVASLQADDQGGSVISLLTLLYLGLPLLIFFAGWLKPAFALVTIIPLLYCGWHLLRAWPVAGPAFRGGELLFLAAFGFGLTAFVGIGGWAPQQTDWIKHNAVLFDCVNQPWPVVLTDGSARWPLVYYLAYYLPAALVGKLAGYAAAQAALWVWSALGLMLAGGWFARLTRLPVWVAAPAFFCFSGLVVVANLLVQILGLSIHSSRLAWYPNESWAWMWQFPSHYWMLEWAPGQALAGWLAAGMYLAGPRTLRPLCFGVLCTCALLWSPFVALGLGLLAFFLAWRDGPPWPVKPGAPLLALLPPLGVLGAFYATKRSAELAARFPPIDIAWFTRFHEAPRPLKSVILLGLFIGFGFGLLLCLIRRRFTKDSAERRLADACGLTLLCLLPVTVGYFSDLSMRASAVPLFGLALLTARALACPGLTPGLRRALWLVVLIGGLTPLIEAAHQADHLVTRRYDARVAPQQDSAVVHMADGGFNNFGAQYVGAPNTFFFRTLARGGTKNKLGK